MGRHVAAAALASVVLVTLAAGCGGKKTASTPPPAATTTSGSSSSGHASFTSAKNCVQLASLTSKIAQSLKPTGDSSKDVTNEVKLFDALASAAPGEIRGDLRTFADAFASFAKSYSGVKITMGQAPSPDQLAKLQAAAKALSAPKVRAAEQHLSAWASKNCGTTNP